MLLQKKSPKFLEKLYDLLECQECRNLKWNKSGDGFEINDIERVEEQILRIYYKQGSFSSFVRQLNLYGFKRIKPKKGINVFKHPHFIRGHKQQLIYIVSQNRLKTFKEIANQEDNLKQQVYEEEHIKLAETLKQLQIQQKQIYSQFKEQIDIQTQVKLRITNLVNQIYGFDTILNQLSFNTQILLLKCLDQMPNDEKHKEEHFFFQKVCKALSELYIDSLSNYINSPFSNKLTPIPFNNLAIKQQIEVKQKQFIEQFYGSIAQLYAPYLEPEIKETKTIVQPQK